jgi:hypothetical protein
MRMPGESNSAVGIEIPTSTMCSTSDQDLLTIRNEMPKFITITSVL